MGGYINLTGKIFGASLAAWGIGKLFERSREGENVDAKEHMRALVLRGEWEEFSSILSRNFPDMSRTDMVALWKSLERGE
jgi:hypothetical protein